MFYIFEIFFGKSESKTNKLLNKLTLVGKDEKIIFSN